MRLLDPLVVHRSTYLLGKLPQPQMVCLVKLFLSNYSKIKALKHTDNVAVAVSRSVKSFLRLS